MLKRTLIVLTIALVQVGCSVDEGGGAYDPTPMTEDGRQLLEREKRDFLKIEYIKIGSGSLAAWGRKIRADIEARYSDGTIVYRGPMFLYNGLKGDVFLFNATKEPAALAIEQRGIWLGLNGMAVGGQRQITIDPKLVYGGLLIQETNSQRSIGVRREQLIVQATLRDSCVPVILRVLPLGHRYFIEREIGCRDSDLPKRDSNAPIWHVY